MPGMISRMMEGDILSWIFVLSAIVLEIVGTTCTKLSEGLTKVGPSVLMLACYCGTCILIALAVKRLEIGIVYAVWCGLGITIIALVGIFIFHEPSNPPKLIGIALILAGTVILELLPFTPESTPSAEIPQQPAVSSPAFAASSQVPLQPLEEILQQPAVSSPAFAASSQVPLQPSKEIPQQPAVSSPAFAASSQVPLQPSAEIPQQPAVSSPAFAASSQVPLQPSAESGL